ncbi:hypothetical protein BB559_006441 [Furculomyces boomerangus]|uniref:Uncharacterized protein n=1 Tax=Furculomyces boomerangus TaxID=61424 RepID=A0A2T9Y2W3_9FUNG|nr:hypothetical protein BB559_006441 [Furculomyces boomerangus]
MPKSCNCKKCKKVSVDTVNPQTSNEEHEDFNKHSSKRPNKKPLGNEKECSKQQKNVNTSKTSSKKAKKVKTSRLSGLFSRENSKLISTPNKTPRDMLIVGSLRKAKSKSWTRNTSPSNTESNISNQNNLDSSGSKQNILAYDSDSDIRNEPKNINPYVLSSSVPAIPKYSLKKIKTYKAGDNGLDEFRDYLVSRKSDTGKKSIENPKVKKDGHKSDSDESLISGSFEINYKKIGNKQGNNDPELTPRKSKDKRVTYNESFAKSTIMDYISEKQHHNITKNLNPVLANYNTNSNTLNPRIKTPSKSYRAALGNVHTTNHQNIHYSLPNTHQNHQINYQYQHDPYIRPNQVIPQNYYSTIQNIPRTSLERNRDFGYDKNISFVQKNANQHDLFNIGSRGVGHYIPTNTNININRANPIQYQQKNNGYGQDHVKINMGQQPNFINGNKTLNPGIFGMNNDGNKQQTFLPMYRVPRKPIIVNKPKTFNKNKSFGVLVYYFRDYILSYVSGK